MKGTFMTLNKQQVRNIVYSLIDTYSFGNKRWLTYTVDTYVSGPITFFNVVGTNDKPLFYGHIVKSGKNHHIVTNFGKYMTNGERVWKRGLFAPINARKLELTNGRTSYAT